MPPGLSGRRAQVRASLEVVTITLEGELLGRHRRSYVPADVVLDPAHARQLRLHREAKGRLEETDVPSPPSTSPSTTAWWGSHEKALL